MLKVYSFNSSSAMDSYAYLEEICVGHQIPFSVSQLTTDDLPAHAKAGCDVLLSAGYPYKIPALDDFAMRGVNVHPTLLPMGRGVWPLPWLILKEFSESGVSLHQLSPQWDAGDILLQQAFSLCDRDNLESLSAKTQILATQLVGQCFSDFDRYWRQARPQTGKAEYWSYPPASMRHVDWNSSVKDIDRTCRAFGKAGCIAAFDNKTWLIYDLVAWPDTHHYPIGSVVHKTNTEMIVAAKDGLCSLRYFEAAPSEILM